MEKLEYTTEAPVRVPDGLLKTDTRRRPVFAATEAPLVPVKTALLPSFAQYYDSSLMNPKVLVGVFLGAMAVFVFSALTMKAVGRAAKGMVEEVRRQFKEKPGIMEGTERRTMPAPWRSAPKRPSGK
jgi:K(+)-stimulated pyrophosphate-energized sodium pump